MLVERADRLGGNSVRGGVTCWEMGAGGTGIPFDIYRRLKQTPQAVGIHSYGRHLAWFKLEQQKPYRFPGGETVIDPARGYLDSLQRVWIQGHELMKRSAASIGMASSSSRRPCRPPR